MEKLKALYAGERERKVRAESAAKTQAVQALFEESGWTKLDEPRPFALLYYGHAPLRRIWKELGLDRKIRQLKQDVDIGSSLWPSRSWAFRSRSGTFSSEILPPV